MLAPEPGPGPAAYIHSLGVNPPLRSVKCSEGPQTYSQGQQFDFCRYSSSKAGTAEMTYLEGCQEFMLLGGGGLGSCQDLCFYQSSRYESSDKPEQR